MRKRVFLLFGLLFLRLLWGGVVGGVCRSGQVVRVSGVVQDVYKTDTDYIIVVGKFFVKRQEFSYDLRNKRVVVTGRCTRGVLGFLLNRVWLEEPSSFDIEDRVNKGPVEGGWVSNLREKMVGIYKQQLPYVEAGLVGGIVLGVKSGLGKGFYDALVRTGTVHIVVASGFNVMVVGGILFSGLIYFVRRKWASLGAVLGMIFYAFLAGGEPPVVRAVIMGALVMWARVVGREVSSWWLLLVAAWGMLMWEPGLVTSISFQLSLAAMAGLVLVEPEVRERVDDWKFAPVVGWVLRTELVPTMSVWLVVAPIIWWYFGQVSWISPLVNMLVLPLVPVIMGVGGVQLFLGLVWEPLGVLVAPFTYALAHLVVILVEWFG